MYRGVLHTVVSLKRVGYYPVFPNRKIYEELHSMQDAAPPHFTRPVRMCGLGVEVLIGGLGVEGIIGGLGVEGIIGGLGVEGLIGGLGVEDRHIGLR